MGWAARTADGAFWRARRALKARWLARTVVPRAILRQLGLVGIALAMLPFRVVGLVAGRLVRYFDHRRGTPS